MFMAMLLTLLIFLAFIAIIWNIDVKSENKKGVRNGSSGHHAMRKRRRRVRKDDDDDNNFLNRDDSFDRDDDFLSNYLITDDVGLS